MRYWLSSVSTKKVFERSTSDRCSIIFIRCEKFAFYAQSPNSRAVRRDFDREKNCMKLHGAQKA
jgi:hypothetical protein